MGIFSDASIPGCAKSRTVARALWRSLIQSPAHLASRVNGDVHSVLRHESAVATHVGTLVSNDLAAISRITPVVRKRIVGRIETLPVWIIKKKTIFTIN